MAERLLMSGNEAIARGAWEAGVTFATGYPGTPSTEILENLAGYEGVVADWAVNEKVAFEEGMGYAIAGQRALVTMKHVGLNVASDPFMVFPYTGTNGGFVVVSADDPGMHSSQNEQDNRNLARMAGVPVIEPGDPQEAKDFLVAAFELSEELGTPVMFRTTTRTAHCKGVVELGERREAAQVEFVPDARRFSVPIYRHRLRPLLEARLERLRAYTEDAPFNQVTLAGHRIGVIANGISRGSAREVLPDVDYFDLGLTFPLPRLGLTAFCQSHETVYVVEEGDPFIEDQLKAWGATNVSGKALLGVGGEYDPDRLRRGLLGEASPAGFGDEIAVPPRPPMFCVGCGHRTVFDILAQLRLTVAGDIGCYTMGALPPYEAEHTTFCMGASIGVAIGLRRAGVERSVAVIGDSTFIHSGIPSLVDAAYHRIPVTVIILDNTTTGMTGQQPHAGSGRSLTTDEAPALDLPALARSVGIEHVTAVDTWDRAGIRKAILAALAHPGPAVVICHGACQMLPEMRGSDRRPVQVVTELCTECDACYRIHCPAIAPGPAGIPLIDQRACVACGVCQELCSFDAIQTVSIDVPAAAGPPAAGEAGA